MFRTSRFHGHIRSKCVSIGLRWTSHGAMKTDADNYGNIMRRNKQLVEVSQDEILKTVDSSLSPSRLKNTAYTIGDFGAADGSTTIGLIRNIIDVVRDKCGKDKEIHVIYEDIPTNDFNCLLQRHNGLIPEPRSYRLDYENVFVTASGTDFYKQCVPSNTLDLVLSFTAIHFLSRPIVLTDSVYRFFSKNEEEKAFIKKIAAEDWLQFWRLRGKELKPGGRAIVSTVGETKTSMAVYFNFKLMNEILEKCVSEHIITKNEKENATFTACFRTPEEMKEPFVNSKILTDIGLHVCQVKQETVPCFFKTEWKERLDTGIDDRDKFAQDFTRNVRTYSYSTIYGALGNNRTDEEKMIICDRFFEEYETALRNVYPPDLDSDNILQVAYVKKE